MIVVDANVAVRWSIEMDWSDRAEAVLRSKIPLIAPDLIVPEATNAYVSIIPIRSDCIDRARDALELLPRWFTELVPCSQLRS